MGTKRSGFIIRAGDGQHLLLAAGEGRRGLAPPFFQDREQVEQPFPALGSHVVVEPVRAHVQILADRHRAEQLAPFRRP